MDAETTGCYISDFFNMEVEMIRGFQICVIETKQNFPMAFG
jgi:hypothetical protein